MKIIGTLTEIDQTQGNVRVEDVVDTDVGDLWQACTDPERLSRWIAEVSGDLRVGGRFHAHFTSGADVTGEVEICDPGQRLQVRTWDAEQSEETVLEVTLSAQGSRARLVIEERGVPLDRLIGYGAGWQTHVEDLASYLAGKERQDMASRWELLIPAYRKMVGR